MSNVIKQAIRAAIAHWSSNSLRPETCDLRPNPLWSRFPSIVKTVSGRPAQPHQPAVPGAWMAATRLESVGGQW